MRYTKWFLFLLLAFSLQGQDTARYMDVATFNIEWFPCKDDGEMMKKYDINLSHPPRGNATDVKALFNMLSKMDLELLAVEEIVDTKMFADSARHYMGGEYKFIYAPGRGSQKVGFLYNSKKLQLIGAPQVYNDLLLKPDSYLRPAFRAYFKSIPDGFDFHAIVVHLKASPRGWGQREKQWQVLKEILSDLPEETQDDDIILLGDMNNVTKARENEFLPVLEPLGFYWVTQELNGMPSNYWMADWKNKRIQASLIDQIFVSADARVEYIEGSVHVGGMCASAFDNYYDGEFPRYYETISDHCPVIARFRVDRDDD